VQLYVGDAEASVARPRRELKAFTKVALAAGASSSARFSLTARDLSYWSVQRGGWALEGGDFEIAVGASSRDLSLTAVVDVPAPPVGAPLDGDSTLEEWLADPEGRAALEKAVGTDAEGRPAGIIGNDHLRTVIGNFPLRTLLAFPGLGIDRGTFEAVTGQAP
jgi:beta-glucosidase